VSRLRARIIGIAVVSACGFTASNMQRDDATSPIDSSVDAYIPDASACLRGSAECIANGQMIRVCDGPGLQPHDEPCSWSCLSTPEAHCAKLVPSGGAVTTADLDPTTLGDVTITAAPTATLDTDTGAISNGVRPAGIGSIMNGIEVTQRGNVTVFRMSKLTVNGVLLRITGTRAAALVSLTDITINAEIDVQGDCAARTAGPGGFPGGSAGSDGSGSGGGGNGDGVPDDCTGGGGGGYGGEGGDGGGGADNQGNTFGSATIAALVGGGGGGGGGGGAEAGAGGGGGGALQLVANQRVTINGLTPLAGGINAGGCGGHTGDYCGGGGGAGGTILIEAPVIDFRSSTLAVNGGGGGGGSNGSDGRDASLSTTSAAGGNGGGGPGGGNSGGDGGNGGDDGDLNGDTGENAGRAGGGGGGVGRMRFNTLSGSILRSGTTVFSPALTSGQQTTTVSTGMAVIR